MAAKLSEREKPPVKKQIKKGVEPINPSSSTQNEKTKQVEENIKIKPRWARITPHQLIWDYISLNWPYFQIAEDKLYEIKDPTCLSDNILGGYIYLRKLGGNEAIYLSPACKLSSQGGRLMPESRYWTFFSKGYQNYSAEILHVDNYYFLAKHERFGSWRPEQWSTPFYYEAIGEEALYEFIKSNTEVH